MYIDNIYGIFIYKIINVPFFSSFFSCKTFSIKLELSRSRDEEKDAATDWTLTDFAANEVKSPYSVSAFYQKSFAKGILLQELLKIRY